MEQNDLVAVKAQWLDGPNDMFGRFVEVGNDHDEAAPPEEFLKMAHRLAEVRTRARLCELEASEQPRELSLTRRRPDVVAHLVVEDNQAGGIALAVDRQIEERGGDIARIIHLVDAVR